MSNRKKESLAVSIEELKEIRQTIEELRAQRQHAKGAIHQIRRRLRSEYGITTMKETTDRIHELKRQITEAEHALREKVTAIGEKFKG
jgi:DNA repair exonuclease SbcCD ATPase subunit